MFKAAFAAASAMLLLAGCQQSGQTGKSGVEVVDAWARLPAVADRPGAAYFTLRNNGGANALTGVQSPHAQRIEFHDSQMHDGMMHMMPMTAVDIARGASVAFQPGGRHAMLFGIDPDLKVGGTLPLTMLFRDGQKIEAKAKLVAAGAPSPYAP